ncbi:hypothetical protein C8Q80DRAFT_788219 [Daedaleopsis nitida]|nr:hypothetical protein C8Q80DRAFT_788219 [Daedaleopsis nitida]
MPCPAHPAILSAVADGEHHSYICPARICRVGCAGLSRSTHLLSCSEQCVGLHCEQFAALDHVCEQVIRRESFPHGELQGREPQCAQQYSSTPSPRARMDIPVAEAWLLSVPPAAYAERKPRSPARSVAARPQLWPSAIELQLVPADPRRNPRAAQLAASRIVNCRRVMPSPLRGWPWGIIGLCVGCDLPDALILQSSPLRVRDGRWDVRHGGPSALRGGGYVFWF